MLHHSVFPKLIIPTALLLASATTAMADEQGELPEESVAESAAAEPSAAEPAPAATGDSAAEATEEEEGGTSGYFRLDGDDEGLQIWVGASHMIGSIELASNVIYSVDGEVELDIGPVFTLGNLSINPMVGVSYIFAPDPLAEAPGGNLTYLVAPQLYITWENDKLYFESWAWLSIPLIEGDDTSLYTRNFLLYKLYDELQVGGQIEATYYLGDEGGLWNLPIGLAASVGYGKDNTLGVFLGYETQKGEESDGIAGRFTFIRNW